MPSPIVNQLTICNSALLKMGGDVISSIDSTQRAAVVCKTLYELLRDETMGSAPWRFALKRAVLYPNATVPAFTYSYSYDIPNDCLRLIIPDDDQIIWVVEGNQILTNETSLDMKYIYRNTDENSWDARFADALAWRLAVELSLSLTQSLPMKQEMEKSYHAAIAEARSMNAVVGNIPKLEADIWSGARKGNRFFRPSAGQTT